MADNDQTKDDSQVDSVSSLAGSAMDEGVQRVNDFTLDVCKQHLNKMAREQSIVNAGELSLDKSSTFAKVEIRGCWGWNPLWGVRWVIISRPLYRRKKRSTSEIVSAKEDRMSNSSAAESDTSENLPVNDLADLESGSGQLDRSRFQEEQSTGMKETNQIWTDDEIRQNASTMTTIETPNMTRTEPLLHHRSLSSEDSNDHSSLLRNSLVSAPNTSVSFEVTSSDMDDIDDAGDSSSEIGRKSRPIHSDILTQMSARRHGHQSFREIMETHRSESGSRLIDPPQRLAQRVDVETGRETTRTQIAVIRGKDERHPQLRRRRIRKQATKAMKRASLFGRNLMASPEEYAERGNGRYRYRTTRNISPQIHREESALDRDPQYRLFTVDSGTQNHRGPIISTSPTFLEQIMAGDEERGCSCFGVRPNQLVVSYLFWAFRSSFLALFLSAAVWFFTLTVSFAIIIYVLGLKLPECINVDGIDFDGKGGPYFMDAYSLSWTTFSTVGYGLVHPATSTNVENARKCFLITVICTWESFIGILIASFWSAIFLSKVTRISSFAQVKFSTPILIRYGEGVGGTVIDDDDEEDHNHESSEEFEENGTNTASRLSRNAKISRSELSRIPCPVLEFRILNRLHSQKSGEIMDASLSIAASVDSSQIEEKLKGGARKKRGHGKRKGANSTIARMKDILDEELPSREEWDSAHSEVFEKLKERATKTTVTPLADLDGSEFDSTASVAIRKVFTRINVESQEHPCFRRIWMAKHILDEESPLLKPEVKRLIRLNNGHFPQVLNSAHGVRASVKFDQILVSLSGTSNADCNSVYSQNIYSYEDLCVGYKFANMLFRDSRGHLQIDEEFLNDVVMQTGGGGEDLFEREATNMSTHGQIFIL